ncbi:hypothetical protein C8J57DRAFT_1290355 [Mycena rebaudengoi]|nr:hypothetical protein C8J57DRAFT_1290355 [Mycena rebaudengoi]
MVDIPVDIWLYISTFLPDDEVLRLVGVNLHFYNLALDLRYGTVRIETVSASTAKLLLRLMDPVVAARVKHLVIRPQINVHAKPDASLQPALWQQLGSVLSWRQQPSAQAPPSVEDVIDALILVFPGLTNLTHFEVESWDMPLEYDLQRFFRGAWSSFGQQLKAISMAGRTEAWRQFVVSGPQLNSCEALSMQFTHELDSTAGAAVVGILVGSVAPFINSLAPQLQSLKMWSLWTLDLSPLFAHLTVFPHLSNFHLRAPFNKAFPDPTGLTRLLQSNSASLKKVELRLNPSGSVMDPTSEERLGQWMLSHNEFPSILADLDFLRIFPTTLRSGFDALVMYTQRSADTLTTLAVKDRYLDLNEVATLILPVSHRGANQGLRFLRLNVRRWSVELFELLASKLPGLQSLSLYVGGSHPNRATTEIFFAKMRAHSFKDWKLRDIGVWQGGSEVPPSTMHLLAASLPHVQSFWGNGHMHGDAKIYYLTRVNGLGLV